MKTLTGGNRRQPREITSVRPKDDETQGTLNTPQTSSAKDPRGEKQIRTAGTGQNTAGDNTEPRTTGTNEQTAEPAKEASHGAKREPTWTKTRRSGTGRKTYRPRTAQIGNRLPNGEPAQKAPTPHGGRVVNIETTRAKRHDRSGAT